MALAAVAAFTLTATACSGGESASTTTTKSRLDMQREAAAKDGLPTDLKLVNEGGDVSASDAVDSMRVTAVGKTRTDVAATETGSAGGSTSSGTSSGSVTPQAPRPTSSGSVTPEAQTPVVPWSGIETRVEVSSSDGMAFFKGTVCNTTSRQRTIVQNKAAAAVVVRSMSTDARLEAPAPGSGSLTITLAPNECRQGVVPLTRGAWNSKNIDEKLIGSPFKVVVTWDATELGTPFSGTFESPVFSV